jgi:hypothetical protein
LSTRGGDPKIAKRRRTPVTGRRPRQLAPPGSII